MDEKRIGNINERERRKIDRREPKAGVNIRHDDGDYVPKRIKLGRELANDGKASR